MSNSLSLLALATLLAAPASAQCPGVACDANRVTMMTPLAESSPGQLTAPFTRQPMFTLPRFDVNAIAAQNMTTPESVELICVHLEFQGIIVPSGMLTNESGAPCTANWNYSVQTAIFSNGEVPVPGTLFVANNVGAQALDTGASAILPMTPEDSTLVFFETSDFTGWIGPGNLVWEGDGLAFGGVTGCSPITSSFDNVVTMSARVTYTYCIPDNPPPGGPGFPYCFGDGSGTDCPCDNESPSGSGQGCLHGNGVGGNLTATGSNSLGANNLVMSGSNLIQNNPALLFSGLNATGAGLGIMDFDGLRCAGGSVIRHGSMTPPANGMVSYGPGIQNTGSFSAGDTRRFQIWYRSAGANSACGNNANFTNGYEVTFTP